MRSHIGRADSWVGRALVPTVTIVVTILAACGDDAGRDAGEADPNDMARADDAGIVGPLWHWVSFQGMDDSFVQVPNPENYTLQLSEDGQVAIRADCNRGTGSYTLESSALQFGPLALTRAACPPESLADQYLSHLGYVRSYVTRDGDLYLSLFADGGILRFTAAEGG